MKTRYLVIADIPTYTEDDDAAPADFVKGDVVETPYDVTKIDADGDVYMRTVDGRTTREGHIAFTQLQEIAPTPDDSHSLADLLAAATLLDLSAELAKILRVATALRDLETTVRETRA